MRNQPTWDSCDVQPVQTCVLSKFLLFHDNWTNKTRVGGDLARPGSPGKCRQNEGLGRDVARIFQGLKILWDASRSSFPFPSFLLLRSKHPPYCASVSGGVLKLPQRIRAKTGRQAHADTHFRPKFAPF